MGGRLCRGERHQYGRPARIRRHRGVPVRATGDDRPTRRHQADLGVVGDHVGPRPRLRGRRTGGSPACSGIRLITTRKDTDMTETITAQAPAGLVFDKDGDIDQQTMDDLMAAIRTAAVTDLVVFSHGWNNDEAAAKSLYERWFGLLAAQVGAGRNVGYVGIRWPAQLWRDEPIPDFPAAPAADHGGAAGLNETPVIEAGSSTIDPAPLARSEERRVGEEGRSRGSPDH